VNEAVALGVVLGRRHRERFETCRAELAELRAAVADGTVGDEVVASWLGSVLTGLGEISGRVFGEKLLGEVFGRFCVGK
jgi:tRNA U34 5-carboxymethylaminomethyl modifying GTPase MnmE/TrmE